MAVVRNLMIRIGADYSPAKKSMDGATRELGRFRRDTERTTRTIRGQKGLGGISSEYKQLSRDLTASISRLRGAKGIGGVSAELSTLVPLLGRSTTAMRGFGISAAGAGARVSALAGPVGIAVAILTALVAVSAAASQEAIRFESTIGRLNMRLKGGSRDFMDWARSMGLAKQTAAEMGATYSTLLSSFISDNRELAAQTMALTQATRVTASATGRNIDDVLERMRSGLLGNTEAIEDLGIFVNVSMIESTEAFRKFANGKSWEQLDFNIQQQIRLAAILEQAYARYGNELQNNTMTKQEQLLEQLKDVKLNLSQAFLPIYDSVLPALIRLAEGVADLTEQIARFMYSLRGWDYDEMTRGSDQQTDAVVEQGNAYDDLAKSAAKARRELAAFDEINQVGDLDGGAGSGGGGAGGNGIPGGSSGGNYGGGSGFNFEVPPIPPLPKQRLEFEPPRPPDAGAGAVATAVVNTFNGLAVETRQTMAGMWGQLENLTMDGADSLGKQLSTLWEGLSTQALTSSATISDTWTSHWDGLRFLTQSGSFDIGTSWANLWSDMLDRTRTDAPVLQELVSDMYTRMSAVSAKTNAQMVIDWKNTLASMLTALVGFRPQFVTQWDGFKLDIESISSPLEFIRTEWHATLDYMQTQLNAYRPYIDWGFHLLKVSIRSVEQPLLDLRSAWSSALTDMYSVAADKLGRIADKIEDVKDAWNDLQTALGGSPARSSSPSRSPSPSYNPSPSPAPAPAPAPKIGRELLEGFESTFSTENLSNIVNLIQQEANKPENQAGLTLFGTVVPAGKLGQLGKYGDEAIGALKKLYDGMKGLGKAVPAFATGAMVYGPTLAMVGDNPGASVNPEVVSPLDDLTSIIQEAVVAAVAAAPGGRQGDIALQVDGVTFARLMNPYNARENSRIGGNMIRVT